jgi:hypothetical protein
MTRTSLNTLGLAGIEAGVADHGPFVKLAEPESAIGVFGQVCDSSTAFV